MNNDFKIAALQCRSKSGEFELNTETILKNMKRTAQQHTDVLPVPECLMTGYGLPAMKMSSRSVEADSDLMCTKTEEPFIRFIE